MTILSLVVPIYNVEKYLDRCIQSLLAQTLKEIEIILVDDVYTTGRTLFYAAECLLPYQPKKIRTFTLAR